MSVLGSIVFVVSVREKFTSKEYHTIRGSLFLTFGISAAIPIMHLIIFGAEGFDGSFSFILWIIGGLSYIIGALLYILKFPERFWPGRFCIVGNSHQIFHILVLVGVFTHYFGCLQTYSYRANNYCNNLLFENNKTIINNNFEDFK